MREGLCLFFVIFTLSAGAQKAKDYSCAWHQQDASILESRVSDFKFSEKGLLYYRVMNDSDNIYIQIKVFDDDVKRAILKSGLTVWIDPEGKKTRETGIKYPVGMKVKAGDDRQDKKTEQEREETPASERPEGNRTNPLMGNTPGQEEVFTVDNRILLIGFTGEDSLLIQSPQAGDFQGSIYLGNDQYMYYELTLPIKLLPDFQASKKSKNEKLSLGFSHLSSESTYLTAIMAETENNMPSPDEGMSGMGGGRQPMGGGMPGMGGGIPSMNQGMQGMRNSGGGTHSSTSKTGTVSTVIFWIKKIHLAKNNL